MAHIFLQEGRTFLPMDEDAVNVQPKLPIGTYTVQVTPKGYHLEQIEDFSLPFKLYGDVNKRAERILISFDQRPGSTGVLLSGQKGSGKTMLAKRVSEIALERGIISIVINQPLRGEGFNTFLQQINQPAIVLFDEFEKTYDMDEQQELLTIFDGVYSSKKLFLLTCNDRYRVGTYMHNRPGRIFYALDYGSLEKHFIEEYCLDNLKDQSQTKGVLRVASCFSEFSFDMLKALVEEMNRFGEPATEAVQMLNMKPQNEEDGAWDVSVIQNGEEAQAGNIHPKQYSGNPLAAESLEVAVYGYRKRKDGTVVVEDDYFTSDEVEEPQKLPKNIIVGTHHFTLTTDLLEAFDGEKGIIVFRTEEPKMKIKFVRRAKAGVVSHFNYNAF